MIRLGTQKEVDEYFERSEMSQSFLKALRQGVSFTKRDEKSMYYEEKGHLVIGSAVDDKISMGNEAFVEKYFVSSEDKPSDAVMSMIQMIFDELIVRLTEQEEAVLIDFTLLDLRSSILVAADHHKYQMRWKEETRINKIAEMGYDYFEELKKAYGKQILSENESEIVENIERSWRTSFYTAKYFNHQGSDTHIFYQVPIYFEFMNVDCKCLLDIVIVNTKDRTIQPIDMKTMAENPIMFPKSVARFGYNFQGAFYTEGLRQLVAFPQSTDTVQELKNIVNEDFTVLPFKFMVETTEVKINKLTDERQFMQGSPLMYTLSEEQIHLGKYGRPEITIMGSDEDARKGNEQIFKLFPIVHRPILGFSQAIDLAIWHMQHGWEVDKKVVEANGDILI
jgi:hypothetical protein